MKIKSIKISNIYSFKYYENINEADDISFDEIDDVPLHILIGPNGAGKSNFVEILNQFFKKVLFRHYSLNEQNYNVFKSGNSLDSKNIINKTNYSLTLQKNRKYSEKKSEILLRLILSRSDFSNIK